MNFIISLMCFLIVFSSVCSAQNTSEALASTVDEIPFEPSQGTLDTLAQVDGFRPWLVLEDLLENSIVWYQRDMSPSSVDRCPFFISCSNYARIALAKYGLIKGLCLFIDRNLYRENLEAFRLYKLIQKPTGVLKLDDSFFLAEDQ